MVALVCVLTASCAGTKVSEPVPDAIDLKGVMQLPGSVNYTGNPLYLPRMLDPKGTSTADGIVFRYTHNVTYDVPVENAAQLFNPFLILGVPKSGDTIVVRGTLELLKKSEVIKRYDKTLVLSKSKNVYSDGDTLTEMRKQGLIQVRDHIDSALIADQEQIRNGSIR